LCQCLIEHINSEYEQCAKTTSTHKFVVKEIPLKDFGIYLEQTKTRSKTALKRSKKGVKSRDQKLDIQTLMSTKNHNLLLDTEENNEDNPPLLLLSIQRMHFSVDLNTTKLNSQEVIFGNTLSVPSKDGHHTLEYVLTGYVLFVGNTDNGHYKVVCKGEGDDWFQYNDETTEKKTTYEINHSSYKRQVIFLLYAEKSYYNGAMECGADF
jgi:hypothetical protein